MPDPITSSTAASAAQPALGAALLKLLVYIIGPVAASVVVMSMTQPREWFSAIISTVMCSIGLGSYVITHYLNIHPVGDELAGMQAGAIYFLCGLPGWFLVRALFYTMEKYQQMNIIEILEKIRRGDK